MPTKHQQLGTLEVMCVLSNWELNQQPVQLKVLQLEVCTKSIHFTMQRYHVVVFFCINTSVLWKYLFCSNYNFQDVGGKVEYGSKMYFYINLSCLNVMKVT